MIGVPVIINHQDVSKENADKIRRGVVSDVWYNPVINWFECAGVIWDETAQNLITDKGWSVSCSYDVKLADDAGGTENNIPYDIEFLDGVFTHLAIVDNPRYERANIVFNSKTEIQRNTMTDNIIYNGLCKIFTEINAKNLTKQDFKIINGLIEILEPINNGWITLKGKVDEDGNPLRVYIPDYIPNGGAAIDFHHKINAEKNKSEIVYEFTQTRANISDEQKNHIKGTIDKTLSAFKIEPPLRGVNVCTIGQGCLGVAITSKNTRTLSLDSRVFKEKGTEVFNQSVEAGWLARTDRDVLTSVLTHELGHTITATANNEAFWDKIKEIKSEYVKNIKENDTKNPDFVSNYARKSKDEFVAECFAQATLSKKPSRYAKMVLDEIKNHFKISAKEYKQLRLFNAIIGVLEMDTEHNIKNDKENNEIIWIEGEGAGYCLTEEEYEERKTEVEKHKKDELKK